MRMRSRNIGPQVSAGQGRGIQGRGPGTIRARYRLPWVPQGAERSHPFPLIPISYELPLGCHGEVAHSFADSNIEFAKFKTV